MIKFLSLFIMATFLLGPMPLHAANLWYWGKLISIETIGSDGSFLIYLDQPEIVATCSGEHVQFRVSDKGVDGTKAALTMAMTALVSGKEFGVVVDLPAAGEMCVASDTSWKGAGIR